MCDISCSKSATNSCINETECICTSDFGCCELRINSFNICNILRLCANNRSLNDLTLNFGCLKNLRFSVSNNCFIKLTGNFSNIAELNRISACYVCIVKLTIDFIDIIKLHCISTSNVSLRDTTFNGIYGLNGNFFCMNNLNISNLDCYRRNVLNSLFGKLSLDVSLDIVVLNDSGHIVIETLIGFLGIGDIFYISVIVINNSFDFLCISTCDLSLSELTVDFVRSTTLNCISASNIRFSNLTFDLGNIAKCLFISTSNFG